MCYVSKANVLIIANNLINTTKFGVSFVCARVEHVSLLTASLFINGGTAWIIIQLFMCVCTHTPYAWMSLQNDEWLIAMETFVYL